MPPVAPEIIRLDSANPVADPIDYPARASTRSWCDSLSLLLNRLLHDFA
jgi:hypothetical protein